MISFLLEKKLFIVTMEILTFVSYLNWSDLLHKHIYISLQNHRQPTHPRILSSHVFVSYPGNNYKDYLGNRYKDYLGNRYKDYLGNRYKDYLGNRYKEYPCNRYNLNENTLVTLVCIQNLTAIPFKFCPSYAKNKLIKLTSAGLLE